MAQAKPSFLTIPNKHGGRLRSHTITTPVGTPSNEQSLFLSEQEVQRLTLSSYRNWEKLPAEVKSHILSFLSATDKIRYRAVNREFQTLLTEGSLWRTLDTSSFYSKIPATELLKLIAQAAPFVQNLNLRGCAQLRGDATLNLNNLLAASFEGCRFFSTRSINEVLARNQKLRQLDISGLGAVNDQVLQVIYKSCCSLSAINLSYCRGVSSAGLEHFILHMPELRDLRIAECNITSGIMLSIHSLKNLHRLSVSGCTMLEDGFVKDLIYGVHPFGVTFPEERVRSPLVHLDISRCSHLTSSCLQYFQGTMLRLEKLELAGLPSLTDVALMKMLPSLPELTHIDLEDCGISDGTLETLSACTKLRHVQLSHCTLISDRGVLAFVHCLTLNHLDLDNTKITNEVLSAIAAQSQSMRVSIYDCPFITWTGVLSILTANSSRPEAIKRLKTFYGWQRPVDGHTKRVIRGDLAGAKEIEREWAAYMMNSSEAVMRTGEGRTRFLDFDEEGVRIIGRERRRAKCLLM